MGRREKGSIFQDLQQFKHIWKPIKYNIFFTCYLKGNLTDFKTLDLFLSLISFSLINCSSSIYSHRAKRMEERPPVSVHASSAKTSPSQKKLSLGTPHRETYIPIVRIYAGIKAETTVIHLLGISDTCKVLFYHREY